MLGKTRARGGWSHCVHGKDTGRNSWQYPASFSLIGSGTPACNSATHIQVRAALHSSVQASWKHPQRQSQRNSMVSLNPIKLTLKIVHPRKAFL